MKVLFLTIGDKTVASTRARVYGYLPFLKEKGIAYNVLSFTTHAKCRRILNLKKDSAWQYILETFYKIYIFMAVFILSKRYDIIFVQKVILPKIILKMLKALNKNIVFDFDDAIYLDRDIGYMLKDAASVIVSHKEFGQFACKHNRNVHYLISPVDVSNQVLPKRKSFATLGWVGSPETSKYLSIILPVLKDLKDKFKNLNIEFMGAERNQGLEALGVTIPEWSIEKQNKFLDEIDIGIMPLEQNEWSCKKAGYKLLLYMSRGIPCVASPVGINASLITDGTNGYLAETDKEWFDKLSRMIEDRSLRERMGQQGRQRVKEYYSYNVCGPRMTDILAGVAANKT
ncbi:MAG: glycosyltransferase family 4 protein [Candidatus Omnitrophica bacterium]|nr:glycosyltransferase family 4 protein [Candidatus Omnitrophota bacterium]